MQTESPTVIMQLNSDQMQLWEYTTNDNQVRYLLAPDLEHAAWQACKLSGGLQNLKDVRLSRNE